MKRKVDLRHVNILQDEVDSVFFKIPDADNRFLFLCHVVRGRIEGISYFLVVVEAQADANRFVKTFWR